ncbi:MAG: alginate export family protein [Pseudomonadota bacterium]
MRAVYFLLMLGASLPTLGEVPAFKFYRWNEDYSVMKGDVDPNWYEKLKYAPLAGSAYFSLGGTLRQRLNLYENDRFGLFGEPDGYLRLGRLLLHADLHLNDRARVFVELGSHNVDGEDLRPGPFDEDRGDVTQAFVDLSVLQSRLRLGRQEMKLGSTRLLGVRDGPNVRRAFDGARVDTAWDDIDLRFFALYEVDVNEGWWDNEHNEDEAFWGAYGSWTLSWTNAEFYYLGLDRAGARYSQGTADETRHSFGARLFGSRDAWDWNYEFVYQDGSFGGDDIRAWTAASITGFTIADHPWRPRVSVSANVASGDDDPLDNTLGTFNPLYPNLMYFEEAAVLAPQNFVNVEPEITVHPSSAVSLSLDWNFFWRLEKNDGVYVRGLLPLPGTAAVDGSFVAHVPSLSVDVQLNRYLAVDVSYSHFFAGEVIDNADGDDIDFFKLELTLTF